MISAVVEFLAFDIRPKVEPCRIALAGCDGAVSDSVDGASSDLNFPNARGCAADLGCDERRDASDAL
jgi:hypothetical protein